MITTKKTCFKCLQAINHTLHGRDGSNPDLCDVCFWRKRASDSAKADILQEVADEFGHLEDEDGVELRKHLAAWIGQLRAK